MNTKDTVAAISSNGAVALIRISGGDAFSIAARLCSKIETAKVGEVFLGALLYDGALLDHAVIVKLKAPKTFTGEDMVELSCHGGAIVPHSVLSALINCGARAAEAGEFTRRAFLNGKTDLSAAEGIADLINAESNAQARAAKALLCGQLKERTDALYSRVLDMLAECEAALDYPEEDLAPINPSSLSSRIKDAQADITALISTYKEGRAIKDGIKVVLAGVPNAGKSSLFNALTGSNAIVTSIAGTTTDVKTEAVFIEGIKFLITDTAGLGEGGGIIEKMGIERAAHAIASADIVVEVIDPVAGGADVKSDIKVVSKCDLHALPSSDAIRLSSVTGEGIDALKKRLVEAAGGAPREGLIITNARHYQALIKAAEALEFAQQGILTKPPELIASDLRLCLEGLSLVTGKAASTELLNAVFSKFCLGK